MRADPTDGLPVPGKSARTLGARPGEEDDIPIRDDGTVRPATGGMSVVPPPPENMPRFRRPSRFGGTGKDPVFEIETDELPEALAYRPDPEQPDRHGFIEPSWAMAFGEYQRVLHDTRWLWRQFRQTMR